MAAARMNEMRRQIRPFNQVQKRACSFDIAPNCQVIRFYRTTIGGNARPCQMNDGVRTIVGEPGEQIT